MKSLNCSLVPNPPLKIELFNHLVVILSIAKLTSILQKVVEFKKNIHEKKREIERNETKAIKLNKRYKSNTLYEIIPPIVLICINISSMIFLKSKLQIGPLKILKKELYHGPSSQTLTISP